MRFIVQNPLAYCDKIGRKTYIENPLITLVRELVITGSYPDVDSALTAIKATYPIHRCKIETALSSNTYPLASILSVYRALTNDYSSFQVVISEISGSEYEEGQEFDPRNCDGACVRHERCDNHCPFGTTFVIMVASSFRVFDNIEEELLHAFIEELHNTDEQIYNGLDKVIIQQWTDRISDLPNKDIIPFIGRFVDNLFDNTSYEIVKIAFSIMGGEYATPY